MQKIKRKKLVRAQLEGKLQKYERRIKALAEEAYEVRQAIEFLDSLEKKVEPQEKQDAISSDRPEAPAQSV